VIRRMAGPAIEVLLDSMETEVSARLARLTAQIDSSEANLFARLDRMEASRAAHGAGMCSKLDVQNSEIAALCRFTGVGFALLSILLAVLHLLG